MSSPVIGFDVGTSTTLVADGRSARPVVLPVGRDFDWIPSVVGLARDGRMVAGEEALELPARRRLRSPKRWITESVTMDGLGPVPDGIDPLRAVQALVDETLRRVGALGIDCSDADVRFGCPAMWTGTQRATFVDVANRCGLDIRPEDLIEEPVAVGVSWATRLRDEGRDPMPKRFVVADLGGGTSDVAVIELHHSRIGDPLNFSVLASGALSEAGDRVDRAVSSHVNNGLPGDVVELDALEMVARQLKEDVAANDHAVRRWALEPARSFELYADEFDVVVSEFVDNIVRFAKSVCRGARLREEISKAPHAIRGEDWSLTKQEIDAVVVAGGTGRMRLVRKRLEEAFGCEVALIDRPQHAVVEGLASAVDFRRINMPRPPFSFMLEYPTVDRTGRSSTAVALLYEAFTPLHEPADLFRGGSLNFHSAVRLPGAPHGRTPARLFCTALRGTDPLVAFQTYRYVDVDGVPGKRKREQFGTVPAIEVDVDGRRPFEFSLRPNGTIIAGGLEISVREWPVIRGLRDPAHGPVVDVVVGPPAGHDWRHH